MKKLTQQELNVIIELHYKWLHDEEGGERADLSGLDLSSVNLSSVNLRCVNLRYANLYGADLYDADLRYTDLTKANLSYANLANANLTGANLTGANLSFSNLEDANLVNTKGNNKEIKSLDLFKYPLAYTKDRLQIGCKNFSISEWFNFNYEEIDDMDTGAIAWWGKYKDVIKSTIESDPAV